MIPLFKVRMAPGATKRVAEVLGSGFIGQGPQVEEFERALGEFTPHPPVSMNACTSAIHAVLMHLGVGPGDEVITTPLTCVASNAPILAVGARPVWADVDECGNIAPSDVERKLTPRTKAIIAVDWAGRRANYRMLRSSGVPVIQDAAHGPLLLGSEGGDYVCYSFGPIKHLTCGDGGAVVTENKQSREALRLLRWYGLDRTSSQDFRCAQNIQQSGMKFHMNDINAAIGLANLPDLRRAVHQHQFHAATLYEHLTPLVTMPAWSWASNYWVFPILVPGSVRDAFKHRLAEQGVMASQVHARNDRHAAYNFPNGALPGLDFYDACHLNIPCGWWLEDEDVDKIIETVRATWRELVSS